MRKKLFLIISIVLLVIIVSTMIPFLYYFSKKSNFNYKAFLTILVYISMVIPLALVILAIFAEGLKLDLKINNYAIPSIFIFAIIGVLIFYVETNFIKVKKFDNYELASYLSIVFDFMITGITYFVLNKTKQDESKPKFKKNA